MATQTTKRSKNVRAVTERERLRRLAAERARSERDILLDPIKDRRRRRKAEKDPEYFLRTYLSAKFFNPFTRDQKHMIRDNVETMRHGGMRARAAPRGGGKTTLSEGLAIWGINNGIIRFPLIVAATGPDSERILANIKYEYETNDELAEDYPEICGPIRALEGASQRARMQTVMGKRTLMEWSHKYVIFPTVEGSKASGSVFSTRSLDAAIRGVKYRNVRPDWWLIDDPETRESVKSEKQTENRETIIDQDLGGVGGPGVKIGGVMLTTIMKPLSLSAKYTDPKKKPAWLGKRFRLLEKMPKAMELWEEYMTMRQLGQQSDKDPDGRDAHRFYLKNRKRMDAGAKVTDPNRYIKKPASDGKPEEASALQHCFNLIADKGWTTFDTEYQNDPPDDQAGEEQGITAQIVASRTNGREQRVSPAEIEVLTMGIDLGKYRCHYVTEAWSKEPRGWVVDYGVIEVTNPDQVGVEKAILKALKDFRDDLALHPYADENGEELELDVGLIDAGHWGDVAHQFVKESGAPWRACKGAGGSSPVMRSFNPGRASKNKIIGHHWFMSVDSGNRLFILDADHWKIFTQQRFMTDPEQSGSLTIFGTTSHEHTSYAHHIVAEKRVEKVTSRGVKVEWKSKRNNHYLDATSMAGAGACMAGISILPRNKTRRRGARVTGGWSR